MSIFFTPPLILLFFLLLPSVFLNFFLSKELKKTKEGIKVLGVIDGDTLVLEGKTRLRLRSVDTPELKFCGGEEAKDLLGKLVSGKKVLVREQIIDIKGRPMALVYVGEMLVNEFTIVEKDIGENWFCTEKEAVSAGFTRSKTCPLIIL